MINYTDNERAIIWLDCFSGFSREQKLKIINCTKDPAAILADLTVISKFIGKDVGENVYNALKASLELGMDKKASNDLASEGITAVTCVSDLYPKQLLQIPDPPMILYCKGNLSLLSERNLFTIVAAENLCPLS